MTKLNIKTGDNVLVIAGKDKGKVSVVSSTSPKQGKVCVQDVNVQTKHVKARRANEKSEIKKIEGLIDISNVMVVCPSCNKATRVARKEVDGKMVRVCKKCGAVLDTDKKVAKATKAAKTAKSSTKKTSSTVAKSGVKKQTAKGATNRVVKRGDKGGSK